jgi:hemerythrin-like metal-binding protein
MAYFDWNPAHDTGIASIDYEHHQLVQALNDIHDLVAHCATPKAIGDSLAEFYTTAAAHFALEENILEEERHPDLGTRRGTHYQLLDQMRDIMEKYEGGAYQTPDVLPATLRQWLSEAIDVDARLFARINDAGLRRWGLSRG